MILKCPLILLILLILSLSPLTFANEALFNDEEVLFSKTFKRLGGGKDTGDINLFIDWKSDRYPICNILIKKEYETKVLYSFELYKNSLILEYLPKSQGVKITIVDGRRELQYSYSNSVAVTAYAEIKLVPNFAMSKVPAIALFQDTPGYGGIFVGLFISLNPSSKKSQIVSFHYDLKTSNMNFYSSEIMIELPPGRIHLRDAGDICAGHQFQYCNY